VYELGWPYSGGGVSSFEPIPDWQSINIAAITDIPSGSYREVPDLGFDADPNTGGVFYYTASADSGFTATGWAECPSGGGGYCLNGGTSMASPLFVGAWAVLETANNNTLGFAAPLIYTNFVGTGMAVKTIFVSDDDGNGYPSPYIGGMYNNVGGLGSINIAQMLTSIGLESTYTISASVNGTGGTIIPSESVFVVAYPGGVLPFRFTLNPKSGYSIASVGGTCGGTLSGNIYITNPVTANCTVVATFAPQ
jgi:subtilase family serine protease